MDEIGTWYRREICVRKKAIPTIHFSISNILQMEGIDTFQDTKACPRALMIVSDKTNCRPHLNNRFSVARSCILPRPCRSENTAAPGLLWVSMNRSFNATLYDKVFGQKMQTSLTKQCQPAQTAPVLIWKLRKKAFLGGSCTSSGTTVDQAPLALFWEIRF